MTDTRQSSTRAYYDEFSDWYERERGRGYHGMIDDLEVEVARPYARDARVLEVGCGTGLILALLAREARFAAGVDLSRGMLGRARARGLGVVQGLATELPFRDASFDLVCSFKVLAHVPDIERAMREMARVLAPGGVLLAEFYNPWSLRYLAKKLGGPRAISARTDESAVYTRFDSPRDVARLVPPDMTLEGFRGVRVLTPTARAVTLPVVGGVLRVAERLALRSPARFFGGFLIAVMRKK